MLLPPTVNKQGVSWWQFIQSIAA